MLTKSKLTSIETFISRALIDMEISQKEFVTVLKEKDKYEKMKDNLKSENEKHKIMKLSSIKSKTLKKKLVTNVEYKNKMKTYCVKCRKDTENIDPKMFRKKKKRLVMQSKCSVCRIKKSRFVKEREAKGLLSNLGIKTPLSKIPLLNVLF